VSIINSTTPSGIIYDEYYLYSEKAWEMASVGLSTYTLASGVLQNAPIVVTSSGYEMSTPDSPWAQVSGSGKYTKRGFGMFTKLEDNTYDTSRNEFALHPDNSKKIIFNKSLEENVYIEYEAGPTGYYILDDLDINPIRNEFDGGFLSHTQITDPEHLYLMVSQGTLYADGFSSSKAIATLFDNDFDRVPDKQVVFELTYMTDGDWSELGYLVPGTSTGSTYKIDASGYVYSIIETTNRKGEASVDYKTFDKKTGIQSIKAYYLDASGVFDLADIAQYYISSDPFTLDMSLLDTLDYLT
jgi:hypothetical protein